MYYLQLYSAETYICYEHPAWFNDRLIAAAYMLMHNSLKSLSYKACY